MLSAWALWRDVQLVCRLLKSLDCLSGARGQALSAACRALDSLILSYSFLYTLSHTFLSPPDFKSFVTILSSYYPTFWRNVSIAF